MRDLKSTLSAWALIAGVSALAIMPAPEAQADELEEVISFKELPNGLDVIVIESHAVPLVTIEIAVKNGAYTEPPPFNGLSHLYEHMFFKGNAVIPTQEAYLSRMRELGIVFNGTTSTERVNYFFTLPSANLSPGLEFMRDAIVTPKFEEEEFTKEIQVVIGEVDRNESNPYYWIGQAVSEKLWYAHPTRKDSLGDRKTITTATVDKMKTMQERYYVPNNSALLIAGDVKPEEAFALAEELYGDWKPSAEDPHKTYPVPAHPPLKKSEAVVVIKDVRAPYINFNWHGPSVATDPKSTYAADVLSYILGQPTSKFYKNLVESGITLGAGTSYYTQRYTGPISASAQVQPGKVKPAVKAIMDELHKLTDPDYFTDEQLESAKQILAIQAIYEREKISSLVHTVSFWWATASLDYYKSYVDELNAVTREDIARYVSTYILNKPFVLGVLLSEEAAKAEGIDAASLTTYALEVEAAAGKE
jgi:zinc protease